MNITSGLQARIARRKIAIRNGEALARHFDVSKEDFTPLFDMLVFDQVLDKGLYRQLVRLSRQAERLERSRRGLMRMLCGAEKEG